MTKIKICGITNLQDAKLAQKCGAAFLGFIFFKKSPRYIPPLKAKRIIDKLTSSEPVGVFVNEPIDKVRKVIRACGLAILQLHGNEPPEYCNALRRQGFKVIKAFRIRNKNSLKSIKRYNYKVNAFLFDTYSKKSYGGTGKSFDWKILYKDFVHPFFLSGGINLKNVKQAIKVVKPYAIDASSSLEKYPGKKNAALLEQFIKLALKKC